MILPDLDVTFHILLLLHIESFTFFIIVLSLFNSMHSVWYHCLRRRIAYVFIMNSSFSELAMSIDIGRDLIMVARLPQTIFFFHRVPIFCSIPFIAFCLFFLLHALSPAHFFFRYCHAKRPGVYSVFKTDLGPSFVSEFKATLLRYRKLTTAWYASKIRLFHTANDREILRAHLQHCSFLLHVSFFTNRALSDSLSLDSHHGAKRKDTESEKKAIGNEIVGANLKARRREKRSFCMASGELDHAQRTEKERVHQQLQRKTYKEAEAEAARDSRSWLSRSRGGLPRESSLSVRNVASHSFHSPLSIFPSFSFHPFLSSFHFFIPLLLFFSLTPLVFAARSSSGKSIVNTANGRVLEKELCHITWSDMLRKKWIKIVLLVQLEIATKTLSRRSHGGSQDKINKIFEL